MTQHGFFYDQSRCTGCHACSILCKTWNNMPPGPEKWMRVFQWEQGCFPDVRVRVLAVPCFHCENPACMRACPGGAIEKEEQFGAVLVDSAMCEAVHREMDCRKCWQACPYGAPQFPNDDPRATMSKCTMCIDRLVQDLKPICVLGCSLRALDFGPMEDLREWYGPGEMLEGVPRAGKIQPAVLFKGPMPKTQLVPWDASDALRLWQGRGPYAPNGLPPVLRSPEDMTQPPEGIIGRSRLVLKPRTCEELMRVTRDDD